MSDWFIHEVWPWLRTGLTWFLAAALVIVAWFLLSGPAYVLAAAMRQLKLQLSEHVSARSKDDHDRTVAFRQGLRDRFKSFLSSHSLLELRPWSAPLWRARLRELMGPVSTRNLRGLERLARSTERLARSLEQHSGPYSPVTPPPPPEQIATLREQATKWLIALCFTAPLVLAIVTVNTGALSRILQEMEIGLLPLFGGLSLYHVFALLLTATEAGVGVWWGVSRLPPSLIEDTVPSMGSLVPPIFATGFATIEGFFYSRFGVEAETPPFMLGQYEFGMQSAFFLLGFFLPLVLFALGDILFRAIVSFRQCHLPRRLSAELRANLLEATRRESRLKSVEDHLSRVRVAAQRALASLQASFGDNQPDLLGRLQELELTLATLGEKKPSWEDTKPVPLSDAGAEHYAFRVAGSLLLALAAATFTAWIHAATLPGRYFAEASPGAARVFALGPWLAAVISLAKTASLLTAGLFLRSRSIALDAQGEVRPLYGRLALGGQVMGMTIALAILGFDSWQVASPDGPILHRFAWSAVFVADMAAVLLGRDLPSMLALVPPLFGVALDAVLLLIRWLARGALALLESILALMIGVLQLLAEPWARIVAWRR